MHNLFIGGTLGLKERANEERMLLKLHNAHLAVSINATDQQTMLLKL
jgi:hypothetical protein